MTKGGTWDPSCCLRAQILPVITNSCQLGADTAVSVQLPKQLCLCNQIPPFMPLLEWANHCVYLFTLTGVETHLSLEYMLGGESLRAIMEIGPDASLQGELHEWNPELFCAEKLPAEPRNNQNDGFSWTSKCVFLSLVLWTDWNRWQYPPWLLPSKMRSPLETWHCHFQNKFWLKGESLIRRRKQAS